jgi:sporulation protein YlmC with PRC-barrel domain
MATNHYLSSLYGVPVIAFEEGLRLGKVYDMHFDRRTKRLQGIVFKSGVLRREQPAYFDAADILKIGRDVVIVSREAAERPLPDSLADCSLRQLKGLKAATREGAHVGAVADLDIDREDGRITEIVLDGQRVLAVEAADIVIGPDVVLLPAGYAARIRPLAAEGTGERGAAIDPSAVTGTIRHKVQEIRASVSSAKSTDKVVETLRSGTEKTRATFRRTSRKLQETLAQIRNRKAGVDEEAGPADTGVHGRDAEATGQPDFGPAASRRSPGESRKPEAGDVAEAGRHVPADDENR